MIIEMYGDSTQAGVSYWNGVAHQEEWTPAKVLAARLGSGFEVRNYGIGGTKLQQAADGSKMYDGLSFAEQIAQSDADIVICNWGINDAYIRGNTPEAHRDRWYQVADIVRGAGKKFVLQTPNPISVDHGAILAELVSASRAVPNDCTADVYAHVLWVYPQWQVHLSDGIHPNGILYSWMGHLIHKSVQPLIARSK